jgi:hypothetical protein
MLSRLEADRCGSSAPGKVGLENPKTYLKNPSGRKEGFTPSPAPVPLSRIPHQSGIPKCGRFRSQAVPLSRIPLTSGIQEAGDSESGTAKVAKNISFFLCVAP